MASVREAAAHINSLVDKIHVHINNAGTAPVREFKKSVDGIEMQFAANYLGSIFPAFSVPNKRC